jgi:hypothetical protein
MPFTGQTPTLLIKPIRPPEKDIYKTMWDKPEYRVVSPGEMIAKEFLRQAKPVPNSSVIDLGCGTGRGSKALSLFGNLKCYCCGLCQQLLGRGCSGACG